MSPADAHGRERLTEESERALARQAAVAALTAVGRMRAEAGSGAGSGAVSGSVAGSGSGSGAGAGASAGRQDGSRIGRPVGFASPERAVRRRVRGGWAARG